MLTCRNLHRNFLLNIEHPRSFRLLYMNCKDFSGWKTRDPSWKKNKSRSLARLLMIYYWQGPVLGIGLHELQVVRQTITGQFRAQWKEALS